MHLLIDCCPEIKVIIPYTPTSASLETLGELLDRKFLPADLIDLVEQRVPLDPLSGFEEVVHFLCLFWSASTMRVDGRGRKYGPCGFLVALRNVSAVFTVVIYSVTRTHFVHLASLAQARRTTRIDQL